ncbi:MAG: hypothetical protein DRO88_07515 [Promethearchaeia archaeon]|nr:MAG: hypothetical protein DRO88_07515 [Candidatus Lokiarchaeia archaeon]
MGKLKRKSCILAFDDGKHEKSDLMRYRPQVDPDSSHMTDLIGVITKGLQLMHVSSTRITVDGSDSTTKILELIQSNPYRNEIKLILIDSPCVAGFNIPNPFIIYEKTQIPILLIPSNHPTHIIGDVFEKVFPNRLDELVVLKNLPPLETLNVKVNISPELSKNVCFHPIGISKSEVIDLLHFLTHYSSVPEPLRLAHLIASRFKLKHDAA